ncbi:hypothetical protein NIES22_71050 (plasmid) [Calothrix brevissima NIES-22]|nr:hypothetical protein NIES22_71050 [Calothrix brevissima NIES-22]
MSETINEHGLKRYIDESIKRAIRKRCGFGCVICGNAIVQYHHFAPPFKDAKEHNPEGIALLCGSCHNEVSTGFASNIKVSHASKNPFCLRKGFTSHKLKMDNDYPVIVVGTARWEKTVTIFEVLGEPILQIEPPEQPNTPYLITGLFCVQEGNELFRIVKNEWIGLIKNWDITFSGGRVTIRRKLHDIALELQYTPPSNINITKIDMYYKGARIFGDKNGFKVTAPNKSTISIGSSNFKGISCHTAFLIDHTSVIAGYMCEYTG